MNLKQLKNSYILQQASFFKLLSSPLKLQLLQFISFAPRTVEECALKFSQSIQNISLHLKSLQSADLLEVLKVKNYRYYYLKEGDKKDFVFKALEMDEATLFPVSVLWDQGVELLVEKMKRRQAQVVDLRSLEERNYLPLSFVEVFEGNIKSLPDFLNSISGDKEFILICKGRMCERLAEAVNVCLEHNLSIKVLPCSARELSELVSFTL